jgi:hypothetical protein
LAAGFLPAAVFLRVVAFLAAIFLRVVAFLRVALLVLLLLAGIAITLLYVGISSFIPSRGGEVPPQAQGRW